MAVSVTVIRTVDAGALTELCIFSFATSVVHACKSKTESKIEKVLRVERYDMGVSITLIKLLACTAYYRQGLIHSMLGRYGSNRRPSQHLLRLIRHRHQLMDRLTSKHIFTKVFHDLLRPPKRRHDVNQPNLIPGIPI